MLEARENLEFPTPTTPWMVMMKPPRPSTSSKVVIGTGVGLAIPTAAKLTAAWKIGAWKMFTFVRNAKSLI